MDFGKEADNLHIGSNFLDLKAGKHIIEFLDDGVLKPVNTKEGLQEKIFLKVMKDGKEYTFTVTKGATVNSLYGQLILLGKKKGHLSGEKVNILVVGEGQSKRYTILEAVDIVKEETENRKLNKVEEQVIE